MQKATETASDRVQHKLERRSCDEQSEKAAQQFEQTKLVYTGPREQLVVRLVRHLGGWFASLHRPEIREKVCR